MTTRAVRDGDDYVIDGTKHFISNADKSDFVILFAATGTRSDAAAGNLITGFLVDLDTPGPHREPGPVERLPPRLPPQRAVVRGLPGAGGATVWARRVGAST